jgi:hypothetical protein
MSPTIFVKDVQQTLERIDWQLDIVNELHLSRDLSSVPEGWTGALVAGKP